MSGTLGGWGPTPRVLRLLRLSRPSRDGRPVRARLRGMLPGERDHLDASAPASLYFDFRGTFAPFLRASDSPMAIACLRLRTRFPLPLFSVPDLRRCIADLTAFFAPPPYLAKSSPPLQAYAAPNSFFASTVPSSVAASVEGKRRARMVAVMAAVITRAARDGLPSADRARVK
jgi:hypothetical protein